MSDDFLDDIIKDVTEKIDKAKSVEEKRLTDDPSKYMLDRVNGLTQMSVFSKKEEIDTEVMMDGMLGAVNEIRNHLSACINEVTMSRKMLQDGTAPDGAGATDLPASFRSLIWAMQLLDIMVHTQTHPKTKDATVRYFYYADQVENLQKIVKDIYNGVSISRIGDDLFLQHNRTDKEQSDD